jgi:hypothetical protein
VRVCKISTAGKHKDLQFKLFGTEVERMDIEGMLEDSEGSSIGEHAVEVCCGKFKMAKDLGVGGSALIYFNGAFICWTRTFAGIKIEPGDDAPDHQYGAVSVVKLTKRPGTGLPVPNKTKFNFPFEKHGTFFTAVKGALEGYIDGLTKRDPRVRLYLRTIKELEVEIGKGNRALAHKTEFGIKGVLETPRSDEVEYHSLIKTPISLADMTQNVKAGGYKNEKAFGADLRRVLSNAKTWDSGRELVQPFIYKTNKRDKQWTIPNILKHMGIPAEFEELVLRENKVAFPKLSLKAELAVDSCIVIPGEADVLAMRALKRHDAEVTEALSEIEREFKVAEKAPDGFFTQCSACSIWRETGVGATFDGAFYCKDVSNACGTADPSDLQKESDLVVGGAGASTPAPPDPENAPPDPENEKQNAAGANAAAEQTKKKKKKKKKEAKTAAEKQKKKKKDAMAAEDKLKTEANAAAHTKTKMADAKAAVEEKAAAGKKEKGANTRPEKRPRSRTSTSTSLRKRSVPLGGVGNAGRSGLQLPAPVQVAGLTGFAACANGQYKCGKDTLNGHYSYELADAPTEWPWVLARLSKGRWVISCIQFAEKHSEKYLAKADVGENGQEAPPSGKWEVVDIRGGDVIKVKQSVAIIVCDARGSAGDVTYPPRIPGDRTPVVVVPPELGPRAGAHRRPSAVMRLARAHGITRLTLDCTDCIDVRSRNIRNHQKWVTFARECPADARTLKDALKANAMVENAAPPCSRSAKLP